MQIPLQITFKGVQHSDALETAIRERADKLERYCKGRMISCRVVVQEPNHRHQQGKLFLVTVDVTLPGIELAVGHSGSHAGDHAREDVYVALRDSFATMERQIKESLAIRRHEVKTHASDNVQLH